jgi:hypothetical protein
VSDIQPVVGDRRKPQVGHMEVWAMALLILGGFVFLVGWLAGVLLLWTSPRWRWPDKLLGTLIWPGGLAGVALAALWEILPAIPSGCDPPFACAAFAPPPPPLWVVAAGFVAGVLVQFAVAYWLVRRARA